jgi:hypothetical protein
VYPSDETETLLSRLNDVAREQRRILDRQGELISQLRAELRGVRNDEHRRPDPTD